MQLPNTLVVPAAGAQLPYAWVREEYTGSASPTGGGGTPTAATWSTRTLNVEVSDTSNILTLSSNQITLAAGTYWVRAWGAGVNSFNAKARLQNVTDTATVVLGNNTYQVVGIGAHSMIAGTFTIGASKALEIQTYQERSEGTYGLGWANGIAGETLTGVFCTAEFWKTA